MNKHNLVQSTFIGATVAIIFVVIITIAGELYKIPGADGKLINPIKDFLKALHGHHWVGKGIWAIILFVASTASMYLVNRSFKHDQKLDCYVSVLSYALILGTVVLYGFFGYEFIINH